jgi:hypothetical protein
VIPVPQSVARAVSQSQCTILQSAEASLLPDLPEDYYPLIVQAVHDADIEIEAYAVILDDFSVSLACPCEIPELS